MYDPFPAVLFAMAFLISILPELEIIRVGVGVGVRSALTSESAPHGDADTWAFIRRPAWKG